MEKIVRIGACDIPMKSTAASLLRYRAQFGRDGLADLNSMAISTAEGIDNLDVLFRFMWVFAKTADKSIPPYEDWLDTIDAGALDIAEAVQDIMELLTSSAKGNIKPAKK